MKKIVGRTNNKKEVWEKLETVYFLTYEHY